MRFVDCAEQYVLSRDLCKDYSNIVLCYAKRFVAWSNRDLRITDISDMLLNQWIVSMQEEGTLQPKTIRSCRGVILAIWRDAFESGLVDTMPRRIRRIRLPDTIPLAWTREEVVQLIATAKKLEGTMPRSCIPRNVYFPTLVRFCYEVGFRISDVLATKITALHGRNVTIVQHKNGKVLTGAISMETLDGLERIQDFAVQDERYSEYLFPWHLRPQAIHRHFRQLVLASGIRHGTFRFLRRSGSSYCELAKPGSSRFYLGHKSSQALADAHYNDPRIVRGNPVSPPPLPPIPE